jgi:hypothetical protein
MFKSWSMWVTCPVCGTGGQSFGILGNLKRRCSMTCRHCGARLSSDLGTGTRIVLSIYSTLIAMVVGLPFMVALVNGNWILAAGAALAILLLVLPPYIICHARNAKAEP